MSLGSGNFWGGNATCRYYPVGGPLTSTLMCRLHLNEVFFFVILCAVFLLIILIPSPRATDLEIIKMSSSEVPPIAKVAPASNGPRAQGKVVIITGKAGLDVSSSQELLTEHLSQRCKLSYWHREGYSASVRSERRQGSLHLRLRRQVPWLPPERDHFTIPSM